MALYFRPTNAPEQSIYIDGFSQTSTTVLNSVSKLTMIPFFNLVNGKIPNIVAPGGYNGSENFIATYSGTILTIGAGYCLMNEMLIEISQPTIMDLSNTEYFFDNYDFSRIRGISGSGYSGTSYEKVYSVVYYNPIGTTGYSGFNGLNIDDTYSAYVGLLCDHRSFYNNQSKFCFLYCIDVTVDYKGRIISIINVSYKNTSISYMKRKTPDYI